MRQNKSYCIYILYLQSKNNDNNLRYYIGLTNDFDRRLKEHVAGRSNYTSKFRILNHRIIEKDIKTLAEARQRELYYKSLKSRQKALFFMNNDCANCKYYKNFVNCKFQKGQYCGHPENDFDGLCSCEACPLMEIDDLCDALRRYCD